MVLAAILFGLTGIFVIVMQLFLFLSDGSWLSVSLGEIFGVISVFLEPDSTWFDSPESWIGVWKILHWMPFSLTSFLAAVALVAGADAVSHAASVPVMTLKERRLRKQIMKGEAEA